MSEICERCYRPIDQGNHGLYKCPLERRGAGPTIFADDIPGGVQIVNGLCHADGSPRTFYSRSAIREAAKAKGLIPWTEVYEEGRTKDARVHDDWLRSGEAQRARRERVEARRERAEARR